RVFFVLAPLLFGFFLGGQNFPKQTRRKRTRQPIPPAATAPANPGAQTSAGNTSSSVVPAAAAVAPPAVVIGEKSERPIVVENDLYRVEFSNRGGVVKSWKLKKYLDDAKPRQQVLDLVHTDASKEIGGWPFAI